MADNFDLTDLPNEPTPASTALIYVVVDPGGGGEADANVVLADLATALAGMSGMTGVFVAKTLFNANTILIATADNDPAPLTVGASTFVGRKAAGNIVAMTPAEAGDLLGTYAAYTPTISQNGTRTTSTLVARYNQVGKKVHAWGYAVLSNAGTAGNSIGVTLPVTPHASIAGNASMTIGSGAINDVGTAFYNANAVPDGPGLVFYSTVQAAASTANRIGVSPSFALASGDIITWDILYEAA